ncbi:MAG: hypothetical protein ACK5II_06410 [Paracoccus sp. (in: a-proteobacteria)]
MDENGKPKAMVQVIQIDEVRIGEHLGEMVRGTVEEALNAILDAEADWYSRILALSRNCSGRVLMLCGLVFAGHG